jgi:hypothetical protein
MGGKAVKGVDRIYKNEMLPTLHVLQEHLYQALGLTLQDQDYIVCGSFLGKESCGDIDIAFDWKRVKFPRNATKEEITKRLNDLYVTLPDYFYNKGFDIHSIPFPIFNENGRTDRFVQVDIMGVDNLEMAKWGMYSDPNSEFKSALRNSLLNHIANEIREDNDVDYNGRVLTFTRLGFDHQRGLFRIKKTYKGAKEGFICKNSKTLEKEIIQTHPVNIVRILFNEDIEPSKVNDWKFIWDKISNPSFHLYNRLFSIVSGVVEEMERKQLDYPSEIKEWWNEQLEDDCK